MSRFTPQGRGLLDQTSLSEVTRQQFGLVLGNLGELAFKGFGDTSVKRASRLAQQRAIGRILHQRVLEQIRRVRWRALPKQQACLDKAVERRLEFGLRLAGHSSQQNMREFASNSCSNLRHFLGGAEPVKPRH